ncbi:MAG TPA: zf-HC2 domain-containing protein [Actinomycetales bacterium]|nr:zf-HC2 domain-containing protein [Actinomycetales bacterium]
MSHEHRCNRPELAHDDAAFVLGALSDDERQAYTDHLRECSACRRSVTEFAPLPALLSRVPIDVVRSLDDSTETQDVDDTHVDLLPALLARVAREERRQRRTARRWFAAGAGVAAAAAAAVALAVVPGGPFVSTGNAPGAASRPSPSVSAQQAADRTATLTALQPTGMKVDVALTSVAWGTRIRITCTYPGSRYGTATAGSSSYALVVRSAGGAEQQVAAWGSVPGRQVTVDGATAIPLTAIRTLEVRDASGAAVMRAQV